ncbi:MAG TPA: ABC transporter ATP-binding protein [Candidatus Mediterraneibacter norfolkensis]|nr:ABC transporter ATP-binding protein [Candidatus Mediterraneibacter norfolkensis]
MAYIEFKNIDKYYGDNHVLKGINLEINKGDFVTLLGPSGCGKSTLLRCLAGLEQISGGQIMLDGEDITNKDPKDRNIGMVFQQYSLFPNMTVEENLSFGLKLQKLDNSEISRRVKDAIDMVELKGKEKEYPANLSGGQQQRVALARGIVMQPKVLLLDEPLSAIDAKLRKSLQTSIRRIHKELGFTSVFVTHDQDEAMVMSDVIHLFHEGKIEQSGSPVEVYTKPVTSFAAGFIGNYNILDSRAMELITGKKWKDGQIAIRPETFFLSRNEITTEDYCMQGVITDSVPRGNVLRYTININDVEVYADVLFRSISMYNIGDRLNIGVSDHNCVRL